MGRISTSSLCWIALTCAPLRRDGHRGTLFAPRGPRCRDGRLRRRRGRGGIAGLVTAAGLCERDVRSVWVCERDELRPVGVGSPRVPGRPRSRTSARSSASPISRRRDDGDQGNLRRAGKSTCNNGGAGGGGALLVVWCHLQRALAERLTVDPATGVVTVSLRDAVKTGGSPGGATATATTATCWILVGADGIWSRVGEQILAPRLAVLHPEEPPLSSEREDGKGTKGRWRRCSLRTPGR